MKTLLILRHAKAEAARERQPDHDRALTSRGLHDAVRIGEYLVEKELVPQWILSSTATRARQTAQLVAATCGFQDKVELCSEIYLSPPGVYLERIHQATDEREPLLVVGHNPGLEVLVSRLTVQDVSLATAALAVIHANVKHWRDLSPDQGYALADLVHASAR